MKRKEKYESEKTKKLRKITRRKDFLIKIIGFPIIMVNLFVGLNHLSSLPNKIATLFGVIGLGTIMIAELFTLTMIIDKNGFKRERLIAKLNAEEEWKKLGDKEKEKVKELSKNAKTLLVAKTIKNLDFKEQDLDLLKEAVLNKEIVAFMNNTRNKKCFLTAFSYDYDENLEEEYQELTADKEKQKIKSIKNEFNKNN